MNCGNEFKKQVEKTLYDNHMYDVGSPITDVRVIADSAVLIEGYFNWVEHLVVTSNEELVKAIKVIQSSSWNIMRHLYAKEYVRSRQMLLMACSEHLLTLNDCEVFYRDGLLEAMVRVP